jgi:putative ABC transport system permease protein
VAADSPDQRRHGMADHDHDHDRDARGDLDAELAFHFAETVEALVARGWTPDAARAEADRRFGDRRQYRRTLARIDRSVQRRQTRLAMWDATRQNLRDAFRGLRKTAGVSAAIVAMLALGIGANATMFSIVDRLLLTPPHHLTAPDRLRLVYVQRQTLTLFPKNLTYSDVQDLKDLPALESIAAYTGTSPWTLGTGGDARKVRVQRAESTFFPTLGVRPVLGRFYAVDDDQPGAPLTAVISESFWEREFARDPAILGRTLALNKSQYQVIGIAPAGFTGVELGVVDVWLPLRAATVAESGRAALETRTWWWTYAVVRLRPDVTDAAAGAQMTAAHIAARRAVEQAGGDPYLAKGPVHLYTGSIIAARGPSPEMRTSIAAWLAGVSAIVLLIACANVANLLLTRGILARRELAVRAALGAARGRLVSQVMTEAAVLAGAGALVAVLVARWASHFAFAFLPDIDFTGTGTGSQVLLFNFAAAALTMVLAGVLPAIQASRTSAVDALRAVSRGSSAARSPLRSALIICQTTLSVVLLVGAGLFVRSLYTAGRADVGFDYQHVIVATLEESASETATRRDQLYVDALPRVASVPGVRQASFAIGSTVAFGNWSGPGGVKVAGHAVIDDLPDGGPFLYSGTEGFFETLGVAVTRGRSFQPNEFVEGGEPVGMVSETFVRTVWPQTDPLTQCFQTGARRPTGTPQPCRRVIGVFRDFARVGIADAGAISVAVPGRVSRGRSIQGLVIRTNDNPVDLIPAIRQTIFAASPAVRFAQVEAMSTRFDELLEPWRLGATMFVVFGLLALVVAVVGLYSMLAFGVAQRRRELGIRAALGASRRDLMWMVLIRATRFIAAGLALGTIIALAAGRYMESLLFGVKATDPPVYIIVIATLLIAGMLAALVPAWRATTVNPASATLAAE